MEEKLIALKRTNTRSLVPMTFVTNVIGCKWVYKVKRNSDGNIQRFKARLVGKGYNQKAGFDYSETFRPVVKDATIRLILFLAVLFGWSLRQLNFNDTFLNGD